MLELTKVKVRSHDVDFAELTWEVIDTAEDVLDYTLQVQRSESVGGPWDNLSVPFSDRYTFFDRTNFPFNSQRVLFYRFLITNIRTGETALSGPYDAQPEADLIVREIRRHMRLLMREHAGRRCYVLPSRTFGQRCGDCWNPRLRTRTRSGCLNCFDTGWTRGYLAPVETWAQVDPGGNQVVQRTNVGTMQPMNTTARLVHFGSLKVNDLLMEAENRRWRITQISQMEHSRATIHYEVQIHEIPKTDIEYRIPIVLDEDLKDIWFSPSRNFTNPHNLDNYKDEDLPSILSLFNGEFFDPNR